MIKVKEGPTIKSYAAIYGCEVDEVVEWVNGYIGGPWKEPLSSLIENTEVERKDSILGYIQAMVETSTTGRIKAQLKREKECLAESARSAVK